MHSNINDKFIAQEQLEQQDVFRHKLTDLDLAGGKYHIQTFGCQLNVHDSEAIAYELSLLGLKAASTEAEADILIFNTCSIRENADLRFWGKLGAVKRFKRRNKNLLIIVCGCMTKLEPHVEKLRASFPYVNLVFCPDDIYRVPELLYKYYSERKNVYDIGSEVIAEGIEYKHERRFRAFLTIMYGCNNFCTYCIVPYTRGRERSRRPEDIITEAKKLVAQGYPELMLLGQNVNSYAGVDADGQSVDFPSLLKRICDETGIYRVRFMTSHPKDISAELLQLMSSYPQIERHLHLPLQSGSSEILRKMNRSYTAEQYMQVVELAKNLMPDLAISTDIIVGFPGETEEDFQATLDIVAEVGYDSAFTFQYSPRYGTPAALEADQIPQEVVTERFNRLLELQNANCLASNEARVGKTFAIIIEGKNEHKETYFTGRPSDFHLINFYIPEELRIAYAWDNISDEDLGRILEGRIAQVYVEEATGFSLNARLERLI